jgi:FkbM family methyltransferase
MKLKEVLYLFGWKPSIRTYDSSIESFHLSEFGKIEYAQWLHPGEKKKIITMPVIEELRTFLKAGDVAIDIGAHTGDTSVPIALAVGKTGCVLSLEPNPYVFKVLARNASLNSDKTNIVPLPFAAMPTDGFFEFEYSDSGFCNGGLHEGISRWRHGHAFQLKVEGKNLQEFLKTHFPDAISRIRFIKIDAEGYDFHILKSLESLIDQCRPFMKAEVFKLTDLEYRRHMFEFLQSRGYKIFHVESESHYRGEKLIPANLMKWKHYDIFCEP